MDKFVRIKNNIDQIISLTDEELPEFWNSFEVVRLKMEQAYLKIVQQSMDLQTLSARDRYESLLHKYPLIFRKVPLYHIANYLGIAPKSLSRIRSEFFSK